MLRPLAIAGLLAVTGCSEPNLFMGSGTSAPIPGPAIDAYARQKGVSEQEARQALVADNLTSKAATLPKRVVDPLHRSNATCESCGD